MDLFNNPMVDSAKRALTAEQKDEYKRIGEYMYNNQNYNTVETGQKVKQAESEELVFYACQALKSRGDPQDLSKPELEALVQFYGNKWYEKFGFSEDEVPKLNTQLVTAEQIFAAAEEKAKKLNLNRKQRRELQRKIEKDKNAVQKKLHK